MIELILGTYGLGCWLVFKKFKLVPMTTYYVCTAILGGIVIFVTLMILLSFCHPASHDGRFYSAITQVTPQVRGTVTEVPVKTNSPLREGDVLFRIDERPYKMEVERLEAMLAGMNAKVAQLEARVASTHAATEEARSNLLVSESQYDRQARISLENAQAQIEQTTSRLDMANANLARSTELRKQNAISQKDLEADVTKSDALKAELAQAKSAEKAAQETLKSGSDRLKAARDQLNQAEATEREARIALDAESDGENPDVRQTMAELDKKRWELDQSTIRAPSDGYVTHVALRPGQMATPFSTNAAMMFVPDEKRILVATFPQNAIANIEPGLEAELAFKAYPGKIFPAKVARVMTILPEGQLIGGGELQTTTAASAKGQVPVLFEYGEDVEALNLPTGAQATIAVYTHKVHALSFVRKILLRVKSWENYAFFMQAFDSVH